MKPELIPDHLTRLMSPEDRSKMGVKTSDERSEIQTAKAEKELQMQIRQYLNLHEIEFICPPMNRRSTLPNGWPDFTLAYNGKPICFECKVGTNKPDADQIEMHARLMKNGWLVFVIRELREVQQILRGIGE